MSVFLKLFVENEFLLFFLPWNASDIRLGYLKNRERYKQDVQKKDFIEKPKEFKVTNPIFLKIVHLIVGTRAFFSQR